MLNTIQSSSTARDSDTKWVYVLTNYSPEHDLGRLDDLGFGILHYAAKSNNPHLVDYLLTNCPVLGIDQPNQHGMTSLHIAASNGDYETVSYLLSKGANIRSVTQDRLSVLHVAAEHMRHDVIKLLIEKGADVNASDLHDRTPISLAIETGDIDIVRTLISAGARLNLEEADGTTPLFRAVMHDDVKIARLLLEKGARIIRSHFLVHSAAQTGNVSMIEALLRASPILINTRDLEGNTPLMIACKYGNVPALELLLDFGANPNAKNNISGLTALHTCVRFVDNISILEEMIGILVERGADINIYCCQGVPLWYAIASDKFDAASILIQNGADVNVSEERNTYDILNFARNHRAHNLIPLLIYAGHSVKKLFPLRKKEKQYICLKNIQSSPMPLRDLCRITIRNSIGSRSYVSKVEKLPLPKSLHDYLTFQTI